MDPSTRRTIELLPITSAIDDAIALILGAEQHVTFRSLLPSPPEGVTVARRAVVTGRISGARDSSANVADSAARSLADVGVAADHTERS